MSPQLAYLPAYLGLFAALVFGVACNAFLDIRYGSFGIEVFLWAALFAWTLRVGWRQHGTDGTSGKQRQVLVLGVGIVLSVAFFMPVWGMPRAALYMLGLLQAAQNCVTTTRRHIYFGLLVSLVMVMFATAHALADWTMLFYVVPYIVAVVLTMVSEQVGQQTAESARSSRVAGRQSGSAAAIAAATATILAVGLGLYLVTPQVIWPVLNSPYGQPSTLGWVGEPPVGGAGGQADGGGSGGAGADSPEGGHSGDNGRVERNWPTPEEMRQAAQRPGMPAWQSAAIKALADVDEAVGQALQPLADSLKDAMQALRDWLAENRENLLRSLLALLLLSLVGALYFLLRELKVATWLRTRYDFLCLGLFAWHASGTAGAMQYFRAMERLFALRDQARGPALTPREYLAEIIPLREQIREAATSLVSHFEAARYGPEAMGDGQLAAMRHAYRRLFSGLD